MNEVIISLEDQAVFITGCDDYCDQIDELRQEHIL